MLTIYHTSFQNKRNLEVAIRKKGMNPVWIERYNVAEICSEDTVFVKELGKGQYGTVFKGVVKYSNNIK